LGGLALVEGNSRVLDALSFIAPAEGSNSADGEGKLSDLLLDDPLGQQQVGELLQVVLDDELASTQRIGRPADRQFVTSAIVKATDGECSTSGSSITTPLPPEITGRRLVAGVRDNSRHDHVEQGLARV
jgi:hypothetical protein